jgi:catechol 2,3-dioxygenase-like lactoylglutathione lyase family enzyme
LTTKSTPGIVKTMPRIDHVAVETDDPDATASFYERVLGARIVKTEGHPVMAYLGTTAFALHERGGPGPHTAIRLSQQELGQLKRDLDAAGIAWLERDHGIALGVFFDDPDGRRLEAIWYRRGDDPRRQGA